MAQPESQAQHRQGHIDQNQMSHNDRNLAHWDKVAKTYRSDHTQEEFGNLINKATTFVLANISSLGVDFIDRSMNFESNSNSDSTKTVRVLDYACGPGTITSILAGRATEYIGLDLSPNMVAEYNERFSPNSTFDETLNATAYNLNLLDPSGIPEIIAADPKFSNFDLAAVGFGFHHFQHLPLCTQRLVDRLKPGGVLMIIDFYSHGKDHYQSDDPAIHTIAHHGFSEAYIRELFRDAGLEDVKVLDFGEDVIMKRHATRRPFLAWGKKAFQ